MSTLLGCENEMIHVHCGLYKISIEKSSLKGDIVGAKFSRTFATALHILGTEIILKSEKGEMNFHTSC